MKVETKPEDVFKLLNMAMHNIFTLFLTPKSMFYSKWRHHYNYYGK